MQTKTLTGNGLTIPNFIYLIFNLAMVIVSIYLTNHYMDLNFSSTIGQASTLCDINDFWGCDKASQSIFGNVLGVPTSFFGIIIGLIGVINVFTNNINYEKITKLISILNLLGCLVLFIYSIAVLGSLCPMCTVYYILSALTTLMLFKYSNLSIGVDPKVAGIFLGLLIIPFIGMKSYVSSIETKNSQLANSYIQQFNKLKDYTDPAYESPYKIHQKTENFSDAPVRISIFSDFQCPYCKMVSDQIPAIINALGDKVAIQYYFYPLDPACNEKMKNGGHGYACQAAYLSACDESKFHEVHDYIFANQNIINSDNLNKWEKQFGLTGCFDNQKLKAIVSQTLKAGDQFNIKSTPTMIVNGRKLEGMLPTNHLISILKSLVK